MAYAAGGRAPLARSLVDVYVLIVVACVVSVCNGTELSRDPTFQCMYCIATELHDISANRQRYFTLCVSLESEHTAHNSTCTGTI